MKNIAVIAGGYSGEYEISIKSAGVIMQHIDKELYASYLIIINKDKWVYLGENNTEHAVDKNDFSIIVRNEKITFDCIFNIIHGTPGEDGKILGYFDMLGLPYTSSSQSVSALTFNKAYCNRVVRSLEVNVANSVHLFKHDAVNVERILEEVALPVFVKPCNGGSSVATSKAKTKEELLSAINLAFTVDDEILVEEFIDGTEITCGLFRYKNRMIVFPITEIVPNNEFFDYDAKYVKGHSQEITPANISVEVATVCTATSSFLYNKLNCKGVVRIDYILTKDNCMYFLEINTVPGMSEMSIIPQQATVFGYSLSELLNMLLENALQQKRM